MLSKIYIHILLLSVVITTCGFCIHKQKFDINYLIHERIDKHYNVGIAVATIDLNRTQFYSAGTVSKNIHSKHITEKTIFPIASVTKVFTTLLLADYVVSGQVKLSDPAQKYLPNVKMPQYHHMSITLQNLATHTSGLVEIGNSAPQSFYQGYTLNRFYKKLSQIKLTHKPGIEYQYSNIIGLLGDIIANISGLTYKQVLQEKILNPLDMKNTKLVPYPNENNTQVIGYNAVDLPGLPWTFPILESAGAMQSNAEDLAKFVMANMGIKKTLLYPAMQLSHQPVLSEGKPLVDFDFPGVEQLEIALGWNVDKMHHLIWKNGNFPNYSSFIGFNYKTKKGVVILTNSGNVAYTDNLALHILDHKIKLLPLYSEVKINNNKINVYAGKYSMNDNTQYVFIGEDNHLKTQHITHGHASEYFNLYPMNNHQFFGRIANAIFSFVLDNKGVIQLIVKEDHQIKYGKKHIVDIHKLTPEKVPQAM